MHSESVGQKCAKCKGGHHALLCSPNKSESDSSPVGNTNACMLNTDTYQGAAVQNSGLSNEKKLCLVSTQSVQLKVRHLF